MASGDRRPEASVWLPSRTRDFSRETTSSTPPSSAAATSSLMEFVPMSMAASFFMGDSFSAGPPGDCLNSA